MSLINQVLKDLEKRHASVGEVRVEARAVRPLPQDVPRRSLRIAFGLILLITMGGGAWWLFLADPDPTAVLSMRSAKIAANLVTIAPAAVAAPAVLPPIAVSPLTAPAAMAAQPLTTPAGETSTNAAVPSPTSARQVVGLLQLAANPMPADLAATPATGSGPSASGAPAPAVGVTEAPAAQSATLAPKPAGKPARKVTPKANGLHLPAKVGLSGTPPGEYPGAGGLEPPSNIAKQVRPLSERERAEVPFREGMVALQAGDAAEGEDKLRAALTIDPLADKARQALLALYVQRGRREDAERLLEDRLRLDRNHAGFAMALARLQLEHDANDDALGTLLRSQANGEASSDYQAILANALGRVGHHKEAARRFEAASGLAPRNPLWLMGLGVELRADGRLEEARAAFQRARELGGLTPQLVTFVGQQLRELK